MKKNTLYSLSILFAVFFAAFLSGCKKHNPDPDFSYSGIQHIGYLISFHTNMTGSHSYVWSFGDGSGSTDPTPNHTYQTASSFTVTLLIDNDPAKKISKVLVIEPPFGISYSGVPSAGNTLTFNSTAANSNTYLWNFGDGSSSTDATPTHTYAADGSYNVSLVVNGDTDHLIQTTILIFENAVYVNAIGGTHLFHHTYTDAFPWPPYNTTYALSDTSITINVLSYSMLTIGSDTLTYSGGTNADSMLHFSQYNYYIRKDNNLYYNRNNSRITYNRSIHISAGAGNATDYYFTP